MKFKRSMKFKVEAVEFKVKLLIKTDVQLTIQNMRVPNWISFKHSTYSYKYVPATCEVYIRSIDYSTDDIVHDSS